jgi:hypothetical protein
MNIYSIANRAQKVLNLEQYLYGNYNTLEEVGKCYFDYYSTPKRQYILRMLIHSPEKELYQIPEELKWTFPFVARCYEWQKQKIKIKHPYTYLTIRRGLVTTQTDDKWHVDGFSMRYNHLPEQSYLWANNHPTEYLNVPMSIPEDFDPLKHNLHLYIQDFLKFHKNNGIKHLVKQANYHTIYCFDPYVIHRRPTVPAGTYRTFLRLSFSPIPIRDDNNTPNPLLPQPNFNYDGVKDFRDKLVRYK